MQTARHYVQKSNRQEQNNLIGWLRITVWMPVLQEVWNLKYKLRISKCEVTHLVHGDVQQSTTNSGFKSDYPEFQDVSIVAKELVPIVVATGVWGNQWSRITVCFHGDNQAVVGVIRGGYCKDKCLAHMLRWMFFSGGTFCLMATARRILGIENTQADALSRNNHAEFAVLAPQACKARYPQKWWEVSQHKLPGRQPIGRPGSVLFASVTSCIHQKDIRGRPEKTLVLL